MKTQIPDVPATTKQISFLTNLMQQWADLKERIGEPVDAAAIDERKSYYASKASKSEASKAIDATLSAIADLKEKARLLDIRTDAATPIEGLPSAEEVPAGCYALDTETPNSINRVAFYQVDRPTKGKWAGYAFVKLQVADDLQRMHQKAGLAILRRIEAVGADAASARYGRELGICGVCGRTLTNDESRAAGVGPVCRRKMGW
ncbi:hypothetical protein SEA_ARCHIMEDES_17 [Gordonia phage Archimedes]|uniref:Uncharacterized protein n=1 Tax=Gordonia phage Archimedes TaxID=2759389 RepID=A0A7L7SNK3_9CAUD|nr:hypothetical protein KCH38_gp17 [Gordonia phage Archimedes]QOC55717.1 hypothetical protein SEA_ARCHIMEDES_17 [Gordonia phage Archimedes]